MHGDFLEVVSRVTTAFLVYLQSTCRQEGSKAKNKTNNVTQISSLYIHDVLDIMLWMSFLLFTVTLHHVGEGEIWRNSEIC